MSISRICPRRVAAAVLVVWLAGAWAQSLPTELPTEPPTEPPPGLARAVDSAWQRATSAADAQGGIARAIARQSAAQTLLPEPPAIDLSYLGGRWRPGSHAGEAEVAAALPLWLPGQRTARSSLAAADVSLAQAEQRHARWLLAGQVREAGWAVVSAQAEDQQAREQMSVLQRLSADVERRVKAGDLARADSLAARAEALAATSAQQEATLRLAEAQRRWTLLTGNPPPQPGDLAEPTIAVTDPHPALQSAAAAVDQSDRHLGNVASTRRDPPELLVRYRRETDGFGASRNSVGLGVRIPFGGDVRNLPRDAEASSAATIAQRQLEFTRERVAAELAQAHDALRAAQNRAAAEASRQVLTEERAGLMRRSFDAGETALPDLLRAMAAAAAARADAQRAQAGLGLARARLAQAQGITP